MISVILRGGLANQLYQISAIFAHAMKYKLSYYIPMHTEEPHYKGQKPYIFPGINYSNIKYKLPLYTEEGFNYVEFPPFMDDVIFSGFFQSHRYFEEYREQLLEALGFKWEMRKGWVSIHVRRGDYLKSNGYHPVVTIEYIYEAISYYLKAGYTKFLVFSDDVDWCYDNINTDVFSECEFEYSEGRTELEDLQLGSCCEHQIGSNSAFSMWQYILNRNESKTCIFPKKWFSGSVGHNTTDIYPLNCLKL